MRTHTNDSHYQLSTHHMKQLTLQIQQKLINLKPEETHTRAIISTNIDIKPKILHQVLASIHFGLPCCIMQWPQVLFLFRVLSNSVQKLYRAQTNRKETNFSKSTLHIFKEIIM